MLVHQLHYLYTMIDVWICLPCPLDRDAIGPSAKTVPYICDEIQQQTMALIYLGIPVENYCRITLKVFNATVARIPKLKVSMSASEYVRKMGLIFRRSTHELDLDDQVSIRLWVEKNKKSTFIYQDASDTDSFILGIQTEWQLQQMIRFGHNSLMAADSTFGIKKLKYPLCTFLVFDSRHYALSVAWVITCSFAKQDVSKWMKDLVDRARSIDSAWKINGFMIDDAAAEEDPVGKLGRLGTRTATLAPKEGLKSEIFCCPVLFPLWRVRRSWLRNIVKRCHNIEVPREMSKCLGQIAYSIWGGVDSVDIMEEFIQGFVDPCNTSRPVGSLRLVR
ncbi:hypothetical protein C5167_049377 [Papaver somniferum]|uniref:MULE transposase domain-containing protein n=1 Tax=Papaver somniferum TaxID=3469 RepID=A0A4Y7KNJ0_PAPSO|nr:hypothetical protein C5167_049377 [Papaver somniferum]